LLPFFACPTPQLIPTAFSNFPDNQTTVFHDQCPRFVNDISILARWSPGTLVTVGQHAAIFNLLNTDLNPLL
jgi:hypothetical protein